MSNALIIQELVILRATMGRGGKEENYPYRLDMDTLGKAREIDVALRKVARQPVYVCLVNF